MAKSKSIKVIVTHSAEELASFLGLSHNEGIEIQIRSDLKDKIIHVVNRNTQDISTDLMLRVLGSLGITAKIVIPRAA